MPKLKAPLMSLEARGRLTKLFSLAYRGGRNIIERRPFPTDAQSSSQLFNRHMFTKCVDLWHLLSDAEKQEWESLARSRHMTGYAWYVSQCLRPNPGIYLPLQGGTMTGEILMGTNSIRGLPLPTGAGHAVRKSYVDNIIAAIVPPTKEFFVPVTGVAGGATMGVYGYYPVARCNGVNENGRTAFYVPQDFSSITDAVILIFPRATDATANLDLYSDYAANGEAIATHRESDITTTYNMTNDVLLEIDISGILSNLAAGDYVGATLVAAGAGDNVDILGVRFKYN